MKSKFMAIILSIACSLSFVSCGNEDKSDNHNVSESMIDTETKEKATEDISFKEENEIKVKQVALGDNYSAAVTETGNLYLWGSNYRGQLGNGSTSEKKFLKG